MKLNNIQVFELYFRHWAFIIAMIAAGLMICLLILAVSLKDKEFKNKKWIKYTRRILFVIEIVFLVVFFIKGWK